MSPDQVIKLIEEMAGVQVEMRYFRRDMETVCRKVDEHGGLLVQILDRLPDRRDDHHRGEDDPPVSGKSIPWGLIAKIGGAIGVAVGSAVAGLLAVPEITKLLGGG